MTLRTKSGKAVSTLKVADLKSELAAVGLSTSGLKADLVKRLSEHLEAQDAQPSEPAATSPPAAQMKEAVQAPSSGKKPRSSPAGKASEPEPVSAELSQPELAAPSPPVPARDAAPPPSSEENKERTAPLANDNAADEQPNDNTPASVKEKPHSSPASAGKALESAPAALSHPNQGADPTRTPSEYAVVADSAQAYVEHAHPAAAPASVMQTDLPAPPDAQQPSGVDAWEAKWDPNYGAVYYWNSVTHAST
eukprot:CAMPEP_0206057382 /NCGR_PEP_ID=MMETSP1466-20131121/44250_1 /ASSEMBLY_ACC=CAM_ASM_001126 /TAXON_ID=44452 /ORGANISM="Pavlova gyrans, Strain CCMP608" /LENGTH=250 /DNA_ID=CAMNT_0053432655 /DNA_START=5 /DNA_END=753 /DNA_ORIENTATION=+